jgi:medium-chain acyl-[acyl-carrier-protein] hydrolase
MQVATTMTDTANLWMICSTPKPQAHLRLFCFPYAGGGASVYRAWANALSSEIKLWRVQLPGRETRLSEPPFSCFTPLRQTLAPILRPYLQTPFAFLGHSMGALIALELARYLHRHDKLGPAHLFISAHRAPQLPDPNLPSYHLPTSAFIETLRRLQETPETILYNVELIQLILPILRADFALCETYTYETQAPLACPISAFGGVQDDKVSRDELAAWCAQTQNVFILRMFPGNHFFLHIAQELLLWVLSQELLQLVSHRAREDVSRGER